MRELTKKEQILVRALVKKGHPDDPSTIWSVLSRLYDIIYAVKEEYRCSESVSQNLSKEERSCVVVAYWAVSEKDNFSQDFQEAISLIQELIDKRYLTVKLFWEYFGKPLGERPEGMILEGREKVLERTLFNYYQFDLWELLNSHFVATNALVDYSKDFKNEEQRRFEEQLKDNNDKHEEAMIKGSITNRVGNFHSHL